MMETTKPDTDLAKGIMAIDNNAAAVARQVNLLSPLTMAYMGDAVYEQFVRARLIEKYSKETPHMLHKRATGIVRASAQAATVAAIFQDMTDAERNIYRRGRNANTSTVPKNVDIGKYRMATGFEAVIGWLYLCGATERLCQILTLSMEKGWKEVPPNGTDKL